MRLGKFNLLRRRRSRKSRNFDLIPVMNGSKPWWESATITAAIVQFINFIVLVTKVEVTSEEVQGVVQGVLGLISTAVIVWGRNRADKRITLK